MNKTAYSKIKNIQNKALRICLGALKATPSYILQSDTSEVYLGLLRYFISPNYLLTVNKTIVHTNI